MTRLESILRTIEAGALELEKESREQDQLVRQQHLQLHKKHLELQEQRARQERLEEERQQQWQRQQQHQQRQKVHIHSLYMRGGQMANSVGSCLLSPTGRSVLHTSLYKKRHCVHARRPPPRRVGPLPLPRCFLTA